MSPTQNHFNSHQKYIRVCFTFYQNFDHFPHDCVLSVSVTNPHRMGKKEDCQCKAFAGSVLHDKQPHRKKSGKNCSYNGWPLEIKREFSLRPSDLIPCSRSHPSERMSATESH
uniref:(northern house mosquito) hypothetical protein n=1 Tax=Culex pipiens TaxID=7175 RepID=A0A8D8B2M3_CULPI